jgi:hypothetical protein
LHWLLVGWYLYQMAFLVHSILFLHWKNQFRDPSMALLVLLLPMGLVWPRFFELKYMPEPAIEWPCQGRRTMTATTTRTTRLAESKRYGNIV